MKELQVTSSHQENNRQWVHKANTENFRRWLLAPEGASPFDFTKIFKGFGYSIDVTQRNLPPGVPCMLVCMILAEAQNKEQVTQTAR